MANVGVHGAPGLPAGALDSNAVYYEARTSPSKQEKTKRTYAQFAATNDSSDSYAPALTCDCHFNPETHLVFEPPKKVYSMDDIALPANSGISSVAVSEPFPLFSVEAINKMRLEVLADEVQEQFTWSSDIAAKQIRGYIPRYGKFIEEAWKHPKTLEIISRIAGVDLIPVVDYEIGHINISVPKAIKRNRQGNIVPEDDGKAVVDWHRDSYPFVCVLMMSDTTGMIGGETALKTGHGDIMKVRCPTMGCGVVLQGRYIEHQALPAFGTHERITMVTSFRPRSPLIRDDTVLNTVRPISNLLDLYSEVIEYQLKNMEARLERYWTSVREAKKRGKFDVKAFKEFLAFERQNMARIDKEIVEEEMVKVGKLADAIEAERAELAAASTKI